MPELLQRRYDDAINQVAAVDCGHDVPMNVFTQIAHVYSARADLTETEEEKDKFFYEALDETCKILEMQAQCWYAEWIATEEAKHQLINDFNPKSKVVWFGPSTRAADLKRLIWDMKDTIKPYFFISPEKAEDWRVLCCADPNKEYCWNSSWHLLPEKFRGLSGGDFCHESFIPDGIFCHADGWIAGFKSRESAVDFANKCVELIDEA